MPRHHCVQCSYPFEQDVGDDMLCGHCIRESPAFDKVYAPFYYAGSIRNLILRLKHHDQTHLAKTASDLMGGYLSNHPLDDVDLIIPIPLHFKRLFFRRYNQASLVARLLAKMLKKPWAVSVLTRKNHQTQKGKNRKQRLEQLAGQFEVSSKWRDHLQGKHILLIDDVMTTGATVHHASKTLKAYGVEKVSVCVLARVSLEAKYHPKEIIF